MIDLKIISNLEPQLNTLVIARSDLDQSIAYIGLLRGANVVIFLVKKDICINNTINTANTSTEVFVNNEQSAHKVYSNFKKMISETLKIEDYYDLFDKIIVTFEFKN